MCARQRKVDRKGILLPNRKDAAGVLRHRHGGGVGAAQQCPRVYLEYQKKVVELSLACCAFAPSSVLSAERTCRRTFTLLAVLILQSWAGIERDAETPLRVPPTGRAVALRPNKIF